MLQCVMPEHDLVLPRNIFKPLNDELDNILEMTIKCLKVNFLMFSIAKSGDSLPMAESFEAIRDKYIIYMCYASYGERPLPPAPDTSSLL